MTNYIRYIGYNTFLEMYKQIESMDIKTYFCGYNEEHKHFFEVDGDLIQ